MLKFFWMTCVLSLGILWEVNALHAEFVDPLTTIQLESSVHFLTADGSDIEVPPGTYTVESAEKWVRLVPGERRDALLIEADHRTHSLDIDDPLAMAIPGDSNEEADLHYVLLLLPGGQSLEATGTYSGIRPQGFNVGQTLNNAKKTATNTYNQAKSTANKVGSAATNAAQQAAQQGQQAAQQAFAFSQESDAPVPTSSDEIQSRGLSIGGCEIKYKNALPDFDNLKTCINGKMTKIQADAKKATDAALTQANNLQQQLQKPWVSAMNQIDATQLTKCLASRGINLNQTIQGVAQNPTEFVRVRFTDIWQKGMNASTLINQELTARKPGTQPPTPAQLVERADQLLAQLALATQDPAAQCLWAAVSPFRTQIKALALQLYPTAKNQYDAMIERSVKPAINQAMVKLLQPAMRQLTHAAGAAARAGGDAARAGASTASMAIPEEVRLMAIAQAQRRLLDPGKMAKLITGVSALASAVQRGNSAASTTALVGLEQSLPPLLTLSDQEAIDVAIESLRFYGHQQIDDKGPRVTDEVYVTINDVTVGIINIVTGVVALWYEPAEVVGEVVTFVVGAALNMSAPSVKASLIYGTHQGFDQAMNAAHRAQREGKPPSAYLQSAGPFGELLKNFPTEAELLGLAVPQIAGMSGVLSSYHESVRALSRAAASQSGQR